MTVTKGLRPALVAVLLGTVTACGASSTPDDPAPAPTGSASAGTHGPANAAPVAAVMPDVIGGNAGRAREQMGAGTDMAFEDASGRGRQVGDPAEWRICASRPGPNQRITDYPVVFDVVMTSENCEDTAAK